jgi:hypothetical protein
MNSVRGSRVITLKVMVDYHSWPLWMSWPGDVDNPDPHDVVSGPLADRLVAWADELDATYNAEVGQDSGFKTEAEKAAHDAKGRELARLVAAEVGDRYKVTFKGWIRGMP